MSDKRMFPRVKRDWYIEYQINNDDSMEPALKVSGLIDIGAGGICFKSDARLVTDKWIQFAIKRDDDLNPIIGVAKTVWSQASDDSFKNGASFAWINWNGFPAQSVIGSYAAAGLGKKPRQS